MSFKPDDISQIRKYLNGELDARAMHRLERRAQDDPFLMDALEGYSNRKDQQANLEDMQQKLQKRVRKGLKKPVALWPLISVAASVLVCVTLGAWWVLFYEPHAKKATIKAADHTAVIVKPIAPVHKPAPPVPQLQPPAVLSPAGTAPSLHHDLIAENIRRQRSAYHKLAGSNATNMEVKPPAIDTNKKSGMLAEVAVVGYTTQLKKDVTASVSIINPPGANASSVNEAPVTASESRRYITGQVIAADDHRPIPGVLAKIQGTNKSAVTDAEGKFKLEASENDVVALAFVGYQSKQVKAKNNNIQVTLNPSDRSLSEVVVSRYNAPPAKDVLDKAAHPLRGWDKFKVKQNSAKSPDGNTGTVKLKFTVNADHSLSDIKIVSSLSADADAEAIRIIKEDTQWLPNANGKPETVTLKIRFKK